MKVGNKMKKKLLAVGLCVALAFSMAACGKSSDKTVATAGEAETNKAGELMAGKTASTVKLCDYKNVKVGKSTENVDEDSYNSAINNILKSFSTSEKVEEGQVKDGDVVNIDYKGTIDGQEFEGGTASGQDLTIGSNSFIDGFESGLIGANVGDTVTLNLTFPENYSNTTKINDEEVSLAGKAVTFEVKINYITVTNTPELTDDFVKEHGEDYGDATTVEELNTYVNNQIALSNKLSKIWPNIVSDCTVDIDAKEKQTKYSELYTYYENVVKSNYGIELEEYVKQVNQTMDDFEKSIQDEAEYQIKCQAISNAIARAENITVTNEEYDKKAESDMEYYGYKTLKEYQKVYPKQEIVDSLIYYKVLEFIGENAEVVDDAELESETEASSEASTETSTEAESTTAAE